MIVNNPPQLRRVWLSIGIWPQNGDSPLVSCELCGKEFILKFKTFGGKFTANENNGQTAQGMQLTGERNLRQNKSP